ncbi:MAG: T9SS type A sorting domain-containing protein [bacterium]|nr:T9SS type A sorting domain-containing protein [bacterium]
MTSKENSNYKFSQNFPNPFNPVTKIYYNIPVAGNVKIEIYNSVGQKMQELVNEFKHIGNYITEFDGSEYSSGIYFYKIFAGNFVDTKRMVLIK